MKSAVALAVFILVCVNGAQALSVEDRSEFEERLKNLIDYVEATAKPEMIEQRHEMEQIKNYVEKALNETEEFHDNLKEETTRILSGDRLHELAIKLQIDTFPCDRKNLEVALSFSKFADAVTLCSKSLEQFYLQPVNQALELLDQTLVDIDNYADKAKKCLDDATFSTWFSVIMCVIRAQLDVQIAHLKVSVKRNSLKTIIGSRVFLKKLNECKQEEEYGAIKAEAILVGKEVRDCISELIIRNTNKNQ